MVMAIAIVLLVVGSVLFHYLSPWYFTPIASNWGNIDDTVTLTFWVTGFVFVAVNLFMAYCVVRYRNRKGNTAHYEPENKKLEGALILATRSASPRCWRRACSHGGSSSTCPKDAAVFEVVGRQWNFNYRFPGADGVLGTVDARFVSDANPFGINPDDPNGQGRYPDRQPRAASADGQGGQGAAPLDRRPARLHGAPVPRQDEHGAGTGHLRLVHADAGRATSTSSANSCAGLRTYAMRGKVVVEDESAWKTWLAGYPTYAQTVDRPPGDATAGRALYAVCAACHGAQGEGNPALNAPKIAGQADWYLKRELHNFKSGARGTSANDAFGKMMAPMAATLADDTAIDNVVAYIRTLPDTPAPHTVPPNASNGQSLYENCAACHGADGRGAMATNAPRLKGMSDWYMVTQLKNFQQGARGAHPKDPYGPQMAALAGS